jgi:hypothetical protein
MFFGALIAWQFLWLTEHLKLRLWLFVAIDVSWFFLWASLRAALVAQSYPKFVK